VFRLVTRVDRAVAAALAAGLVLAGAAACGDSSSPAAAPPEAIGLASPPANPPADFTTIAAIEQALKGVANCVANGPTSAVCTLLTTTRNTAQIATITPFQVKVFATPQQLQSYLTYFRGANAAYASTGSAKRSFLVGGHWIVTPQVDVSGLAQTLAEYLGGTLSS